MADEKCRILQCLSIVHKMQEKKKEVLETHSCPFMPSVRQFASSSDGFLAFGDFQFAGFFMFKVFFF